MHARVRALSMHSISAFVVSAFVAAGALSESGAGTVWLTRASSAAASEASAAVGHLFIAYLVFARARVE
jgi:hypothetical protein